MTRVLITGAGGFAGAHFLEHVLATTDWQPVCTDSFRHKGKTDRISEVVDGFAGHADWSYVKTITHDLTAPFSEQAIEKMGEIDYIVAYASDSHVDRSISEPVPFVRNNTDVALNTLELARRLRPRAIVWVSTDEVYGPVEATDLKGHPEWAPIMPSNPYAASKAAQEAIAFSYWRTYGVPLIIVNCMNMIGERQGEKFVPDTIFKVSQEQVVQIHASDENHIGTRHYLHARNLADGILFLLENTKPAMFPAHTTYVDGDLGRVWKDRTSDRPDRYNISCPDRIDNLALAKTIAEYVGKPLRYELVDFHSKRPGHDPHYGLNGDKMFRLGWEAPIAFKDSLRRLVEWTLAHPEWMLPD